MSDPGPGGVFVYHPLTRGNPLYRVYIDAIGGRAAASTPLSADDRARLQKRYRQHMREVVEKRGLDPATALGAELKQDNRALVKRFRAFWPALLGKTTLTGKAAQVGTFFPVVACFDNRCVEIEGHGEGVFITSRTLDVIELFANTLAMGVRLNGPELRAMLGFEDPPPPHVLLAWMTMTVRAPELFGLQRVMAPQSRNAGARALYEELYGKGKSNMPAELKGRGWGHYQLSLALTWLMLRAVRALVANRPQGKRYLGVTSAPSSTRSPLCLDAGYFATLILAFIVLHEISHLALRHNMPEGPPVHPIVQHIVDRSTEFFAAKDGGESFNLVGTAQGHESGADVFALEVIEEEFRDPMLEAATLWFAALAGSNADRGDWLENAFADPWAYPGYAMRVWFLNGRLSTGMRRGSIAQAITRQAEALARAAPEDSDPADESELFRALWSIASRETTLLGRILPWFVRWPII